MDITPTVDSVVHYKWRDEFMQKLIPDYKPGYKYNITLPTDLLERDTFSFYSLQLQMPDGEIRKKRLALEDFRTITSFANIKIRARILRMQLKEPIKTLPRNIVPLLIYEKYQKNVTKIDIFVYICYVVLQFTCAELSAWTV